MLGHYVSSYLILTTTVQGKYSYYSHFTDEETKAWNDLSIIILLIYNGDRNSGLILKVKFFTIPWKSLYSIDIISFLNL